MKRVYEITLPGFIGGTDATDHLVVWIASESQHLVELYAKSKDAIFQGTVEVPLEEADFQLGGENGKR